MNASDQRMHIYSNKNDIIMYDLNAIANQMKQFPIQLTVTFVCGVGNAHSNATYLNKNPSTLCRLEQALQRS